MAGSGTYLHTGHATLQGVDDVRFGLAFNHFFAYGHSRTYIIHFLAHPVAATGNLNFFQRDGLRFHNHIDHAAGNGHDFVFHTHGRELEVLGGRRDVRQGVNTIKVGRSTDGGSLYLNGHHRHAHGVFRTGDLTRYGALPQGHVGRSQKEQGHHKEH